MEIAVNQRKIMRFQLQVTITSALALCTGAHAISILHQQATTSSVQDAEIKQREGKLKEGSLMVEEARKAFFAGNLNIADSVISRAISMFEAIGPRIGSEALLLKAELDLASGRPLEARDTLARLPLKSMYLSSRVLIVLAQSSIMNGSFEAGTEYLDRAIQEEGKSFHFKETWPDILMLRGSDIKGQSALMFGLMASHYHSIPKWSLFYLQKATVLMPSNPSLKVHLGDALRRLGRWDEARVHLEAVAKGHSGSAEAALKILRMGPIKVPETAGGG